MEQHQHAVLNFLSHLGQIWGYASHNKPDGFGMERTSHLWGRNGIHCLLLLSKKISCQHRTTGVLCEFLAFLWTFLCINWVFNAFMCIIQIWTTCACSSAYKLVEKSNMCPWVHAYVPCKKWEWISNTLAPSLGRKHWDTCLLNSRLKFMKLGMLSWSGINMPG